MIRNNSSNILLQYRELLNQFIVDMYAKIESERLLYIKLHQKELRVDNYEHIKDAVDNDGRIDRLGKLIILPSSFTGGNRYFQQKTQDAMVYVRKYGTPDLFITFTCNPRWEEIKKELEHGQQAIHRHDIIARIFRLKLKKLISILKDGEVFGRVRCRMHTVE